MSGSTVPGFNASFDTSFANVVAQYDLISLKNNLVNLKPSSLNFSQNCWATCDLRLLSQSADSQNGPDIITVVASDLKALLSSSPANTSETDYMEYWTSLLQVDSSASLIDSACTSCNTSGRLDVPLSDLNFQANCTLTGGFYSRYYGSDDFTPTWSDLVPFYVASLPSSYQNLSSATIEAIAASMWNSSTPKNPDSSPALPLAARYADPVLRAAASCAKDACRGIGYVGNTDLGGIGSLATYFMIAAITTAFSLLSIHYKKHDTFPWKFRDDFRKNIINTSFLFWDAVTWLALFTLIAACVVIYKRPQTLYEAVLTQWVVYIMLNSVGALFALNAHQEGSKDKASLPQRFVRIFISLCTYVISWASLWYVNAYKTAWTLKEDSICYAEWLWPLQRAWRAASWFQAFIPVLWVIARLLRFFVKPRGQRAAHTFRFRIYRRGHAVELFYKWLAYGSATLSLCVLWFDVVCIYLLRQDARDYYGDSYDDDSFGYGQTLAVGFAAQPVAVFFFVLLSDLNDTPTVQGWRAASPRWLQSIWPASEEARHAEYKNLPPLSTPDLPSALVMEVPSGNLDMPESWQPRDYAVDKGAKTPLHVEERYVQDD